MIKQETGYSYNDVTIIPKPISNIKSRSDVNPFDSNGNLPIFTAPMSTVVNCENFHLWEENKITPILPRNIEWHKRIEFIKNNKWVAISLSELDEVINMIDEDAIVLDYKNPIKLCVDVANGHMKHLIEKCKMIKTECGDSVQIMTGNIAHPSTVLHYEEAGIDYVRVGIGGGHGCTTTSNVAIHYPQASLLNEINELKRESVHDFKIKIIADGGIRNFSDVNKALALGADYVMIGGLFASFLESAGDTSSLHFNLTRPNNTDFVFNYNVAFYDEEEVKDHLKQTWGNYYSEIKKFITIKTVESSLYTYSINVPLWSNTVPEHLKRQFLTNHPIYKEFYGMSTKRAQELIKAGSVKRTAEGIEKTFEVKYTIKQWVDNMEAYLRSCMSYCDSRNLKEFIGKQFLKINSLSEINAVNK